MKGFGKPVVFHWNVTTVCNHNCLFCGNASRFKVADGISTRRALRLLTFLKKVQVNHIWLVGGEPFLRQDIEVLLRHMFNLQLNVGITTNGTSFSESIVRILADHVENLDFLTVSIHSSDETGYMRIHGTNKFRQAIASLSLLKEYSVPFSTTSVIGRFNLKEAITLFRYLGAFNPTLMSLLPFRMLGKGRNLSSHHLTFQELLCLFAALNEIRHKEAIPSIKFTARPLYRDQLVAMFPYLVFADHTCSAHAMLHMDADGTMMLCSHMRDLPISGHIVEQYSVPYRPYSEIDAIWNAPQFQDFRDFLYARTTSYKVCATCEASLKGKCVPCPFTKPTCNQEASAISHFKMTTCGAYGAKPVREDIL